MGWSCSTLAYSTINIIQRICIAKTGFQNCWIDKKGVRYYFETSRKEYADGRITGSIHRFFTDSSAIYIGSFHIESDGTIRRWAHCPLKYKNWAVRFNDLKAKIFGENSFVQLDNTPEQIEYDLFLPEVMKLKQLGIWNKSQLKQY